MAFTVVTLRLLLSSQPRHLRFSDQDSEWYGHKKQAPGTPLSGLLSRPCDQHRKCK